MTVNLIQLVTVTDLASPVDHLGRELVNGAPPVATVPLARWRPQWGTPRSVAILRAVNEAVVEAGGSPLRINRIGRPWEDQEKVRRQFDAWIAAGEPKPGGTGWRQGMSTAYAAPPGGSHHGWGGAVDIVRYALEFRGTGRGTNAALAKLWELAIPLGMTPVIREPRINQSEAWHFDLLGERDDVFPRVRYLLRDGGAKDVGRWTAIAAHQLTGQWRGDKTEWRYVQARLLVHAAMLEDPDAANAASPGVPDGVAGAKTMRAFELATGGASVPERATFSDYVRILDEHRVGLDAMAAA